MIRKSRIRVAVALALFIVLGAESGVSAEETNPWETLRQGGYIVLIRHATAPGGGDPIDFDLSDCSTQRNLSQAGRDQSVAIGEAFRREQVPVLKVLSSQWCRCKDTAELAFGDYVEFPPLNSFFGRPEREAGQTAETLAYLGKEPVTDGNLILVTHQVNITALTSVFPGQGEVIVTRMLPSGELEVVTRFSP